MRAWPWLAAVALAACGTADAPAGDDVTADVADVAEETAGPDPCAGLEPCDHAGASVCTEDGGAARRCVVDPLSGCTHLLAPEPCADGDGPVCAGSSACVPGPGCVPSGPPAGCCASQADCEDGDACNGVGFCETATGTCHFAPPPACDDGDPCNGVEGCDPATGVCEAGAPPPCDDGNLCNGVESCHAAAGCVPGVPLGCDDGLPCNGLEACDPASGCVAGDPPSGCCVVAGDCEDGNLCNGLGSCDLETGTCAVEPPGACDDGDPCTGLRVCDPAVGCVVLQPAPMCDDHNACNGLESCAAGVGCVASAPLACNDGNICNGLEGCDPASGCVPGGPWACDDGNPCNGLEACDAMAGCYTTAPPDCDDGDPCSTDACEPGVGCTHLPLGCAQDDDPCTVALCGVAGCEPQPIACDDGDACTTDGCVPEQGGCVHTPVVCDDEDGDACTEPTCVAHGACVEVLLPCGDGDPCTDDVCVGGACKSFPSACDDGDSCTEDACVDGVGCVHEPLACDDGHACTVDGCVPGLGCTASVAPGSCFVDGACHGDGALHPTDPCLVCDATVSTLKWAPLAECEPCGACVAPGGAETGCVAGWCYVAACPDGTHDADGDVANGCEVVFGEPSGWLEVDALGVGSGSPGVPVFTSFEGAMSAAEPGVRVDVYPGTYPEAVTIDDAGVRLRAVAPGVIIVPPMGAVGVMIAAAEVHLEGLTILGGAGGLQLYVCDDVVVRDMRILGLSGNPGATGVFVYQSQRAVLQGLEIAGVHAAPIWADWFDGGAVGVAVQGSSDGVVRGVRIHDVRGGPRMNDAGVGAGGDAVAVRIEQATGWTLEGVSVHQLAGGDHHVEEATDAVGVGGSAVGMQLVGVSLDHHLRHIDMATFAAGGGDVNGAPGTTAGVSFRYATGWAPLTIEESVVVDGDPTLFSANESGRVIAGHVLDAVTPAMDLGRIVVVGGDGAEIVDNVILDTVGFAGRIGPGGEVDVARPTVAIRVVGAAGTAVAGNKILGVTGGPGVAFHDGGAGGWAVGIRLQDPTDAIVHDNEISGIRGGRGGMASDGTPGDGGAAVGILVEDAPDAILADNVVSDVVGGNPGGGGSPTARPYGGQADGVFGFGEPLTGFVLDGLLVHDVSGGVPGPDPFPCDSCEPAQYWGGRASGVRLDQAQGVLVRHLGMRDVYAEPDWDQQSFETAGGVVLADTDGVLEHVTIHATAAGAGCIHVRDPSGALAIKDALVSECGGTCIRATAVLDDLLSAERFGGFECDLIVGQSWLEVGEHWDDPPGFEDESKLRLAPDSPYVDRGLPFDGGDDACIEPEPNGCALNVGAWGGTEHAASAGEGADHCGCGE